MGDLTPVKARPTAERVRALMHYDPVTGIFVRRVRKGCFAAGTQVGGKNTDGYLLAGIDWMRVYLHHVAHLYMTGEWPTLHTDHIDGNRSNNSWSNLRQVSQAVNNQNRRRATAGNKAGVLGVRSEPTGRFAARIQTNGIGKHLGCFDTVEAAHAAYLDAKRREHVGCTI